MIVVICDNDSIHHARAVTAYLKEHPRLELPYGAGTACTTIPPSASGRR